jgi:hypothetical protein
MWDGLDHMSHQTLMMGTKVLPVWDVVALETPTNTCHYCLSAVCAVENLGGPQKGRLNVE